jgi:Ca2+/H+ antiporter, TMEM165/GDT1 family
VRGAERFPIRIILRGRAGLPGEPPLSHDSQRRLPVASGCTRHREQALRLGIPLEAFLVSTGVVALSEIGDKTQLLALMLAARFRRPWPILGGILAATLANHALAGLVGNWLRELVAPEVLRWIVAASFFAVAIWALLPDKLDDDAPPPASRLGVFGVTAAAFFLAEMGDKTQIATAVLAAKYSALPVVVAGTTLGMLLADAPVVLIGNLTATKLPLKAIRIAAALMFVALGIYTLLASGA